MAKLNPVAVTSADLLRAIDAGGWVTRTELFESIGRDPKNSARDLGVVEKAGLIFIDPDKASSRPITLTEEGQAQLAAIGRAEHGGQARRPRDRCMVANIIANPANRRVEDSAVAALADTIEAVGDVLESIQLTPADANGVRMLLDGEHRWRAVQLLTEQGRLPEALEKGLRFEEREATEAEQILIRIVTATARADLSPLDDARQLLALQKATNWSAREIAKKTGRSPADSDTGVRDVQVKIRIAKEATPFFLAQYELDGSWDRLRDSVTEKKPAADPADRPAPTEELSQALAEYGTAALGSAGAKTEPAIPLWAEAERLESPMREGFENRPAIVITLYRRAGDHGVLDDSWAFGREAQIGSNRLGQQMDLSREPDFVVSTRALALTRAIKMVRHDYGTDLPRAYAEWMDQLQGPFYVNGVDRLNASNAGEARRALGWEKRHANSGPGQGKAAPAPAAKPSPAPPPPPELTPAAIDRLHEIADWIDDNPSGNGHGFETWALGRGLNAEEDLLIAAGHLLADIEGDQAAVYLTGMGQRYVRDNPTPGEAAFNEENRLAAETAKTDPAPAEAADLAAIEALAERMRARAERHRQKGGGRWTVFPERELARQLLDAVGNGQIERAAVVIAWLSAKQGGITERSKAVEEAGGSWLLSKEIMGAFRQLAEAARIAADPDHPAHLVQMAARDALTRAERHLRPIKPLAAEVTT